MSDAGRTGARRDAAPSGALLTPTKINAWLECPHYFMLMREARRATRPPAAEGSFASLLQRKGDEHEAAVEAGFRDRGLGVRRVDSKESGETFADWVDRTAFMLGAEVDMLAQMPLAHEGIRGVADFLERMTDPETGRAHWEPIDAKLARREAKPGHVLQLCAYADALAAAVGEAPKRLRISLGSGVVESIGFEDVRPYWARLRERLASAAAAGPETATRPEPCDHCAFCEFQPICEGVWRDEDSLVYVAGIRAAERRALEAAGVVTMAALADRASPVDDLGDERRERLRTQARLQVLARETPDKPPPFDLTPASEHPEWGRGFERLPEPDDGDIFLDFEGHPFWRPDRGLFFLFGRLARDNDGTWRYRQAWAHNKAEEGEQVLKLVDLIRERRSSRPEMHVYHYNHTERSALESLAAEHRTAEQAVASLVEAGVFVDLLPVVRNAVQAGVESYSLKNVETLTGFKRSHEIEKGAGAVVAYDEWARDADDDRARGADNDPARDTDDERLAAIAGYNEDDVRATRALRDWLIEKRPDGVGWRVDQDTEAADDDEADALAKELGEAPAGSPQRLMSELLGYWRREYRSYVAPIIGLLGRDESDLIDNDAALARLTDPEEIGRTTPTGKRAKWPGLRLSFPPQELGDAFSGDKLRVLYTTASGLVGRAEVDRLDTSQGEIVLVWNDKAAKLGEAPKAVAPDEWVPAHSKWKALLDLARQWRNPEAGGEPNPATKALLEAAEPKFTGEPEFTGESAALTDDVAGLAELVCRLDSSVLGVQGPPGTGKTYRGAHITKALAAGGKRVGIMAMSHSAIDNFLNEIVTAFDEEPRVELRAIRKGREPSAGAAGVAYTSSNPDLAETGYNVVAATAWQYATAAMRKAPVDVLLIDEAGQLSLIDAVVASMAAKSVVLLGDPQQLPQVAQATHPGGSGASALGHLIGDGPIIPPERGVFIKQTRRMHPSICKFISERFYEGRLTSHEDCKQQATDHGVGLRWIPAQHSGCSTESEVEATIVAKRIGALLGAGWVDSDGKAQRIQPGDVAVVAPYNDQVRRLSDCLDADLTRGVHVGTVDKFQGRQAPVVFFTMTSSSADEIPRGAEFLFSRHRLNVAISRAQCLAYLVCTEDLLNSRAKTVDEMRLIATLCSFVEHAEVDAPVRR